MGQTCMCIHIHSYICKKEKEEKKKKKEKKKERKQTDKRTGENFFFVL